MSDVFQLLDQVQAVHGWRFRYVEGKWWSWDVDLGAWQAYDSRARMTRVFLTTAEDIWPEGSAPRRQVTRDYMITRLCAGLVPRLRASSLEGHPQPGTWQPGSQ